jgi:hypothetical protein
MTSTFAREAASGSPTTDQPKFVGGCAGSGTRSTPVGLSVPPSATISSAPSNAISAGTSPST